MERWVGQEWKRESGLRTSVQRDCVWFMLAGLSCPTRRWVPPAHPSILYEHSRNTAASHPHSIQCNFADWPTAFVHVSRLLVSGPVPFIFKQSPRYAHGQLDSLGHEGLAFLDSDSWMTAGVVQRLTCAQHGLVSARHCVVSCNGRSETLGVLGTTASTFRSTSDDCTNRY